MAYITHISCIKIDSDSNHPVFLISVYMPTSGKDPLYIDALADLSNVISDMYDSCPESMIILGGDFNNNSKNKPRFTLWSHFLAQYDISQINLMKPTYHHHHNYVLVHSYPSNYRG